VPLPVAIVAAAADGERACSTGTVTYVSLEPALLATPLAAAGRTCGLVRRSGELSISILAEGQAEVAVRAARSTAGDKFAEHEIPAVDAPPGWSAPGIAGAVAVFWCSVEATVPGADALLVLARAHEAAVTGGEPLLRFRRRYRRLGADVPVAAEAAYPL
jgi:flavin reductase (DIM6/NTAB) family NADH-FMN oxidoreductase RutF